MVCIVNTVSSGQPSYLYNGLYIYTNRTQGSVSSGPHTTVHNLLFDDFTKIDVNLVSLSNILQIFCGQNFNISFPTDVDAAWSGLV